MSLLYTLFIVSLLAWPGSLLVRADTPLFYLVASAQGSANLLPLRPYGGSKGSSLTGTSPVGQFYFDSEGALRTAAPTPSDEVLPAEAYFTALPANGACTAYGAFGFLSGPQADACKHSVPARLTTSVPLLGTKLVVNNVSTLYACGNNLDVYFEPKPGYGPPGLTCTPIVLYAVPV